MKLYVGNLAYTVTEQELQDLFAPYGEVKSVNIVKDKFTGQARGFGFVEMGDKDMGKAAIDGLNGTDIGGRKIRVNEALAKEAQGGRPRSFGDRGGRGGGRGGFGGGRGGFGGRNRGGEGDRGGSTW
jgi:RNA recognition motif-containing protein